MEAASNQTGLGPAVDVLQLMLLLQLMMHCIDDDEKTPYYHANPDNKFFLILTNI